MTTSTEFRIVTPRGTVIERYKVTGVGKLVGNRLYLHEDYALHAIAIIKARNFGVGLKLERSLAFKIIDFDAFQFRCLRFDLSNGAIRFDEAPDFDTAREPHVGKWMLVHPGGWATRGESQAIWHHRWLWIKPNSRPWEASAREWSAKYVPLLKEPPKGNQRGWLAQLAEIGLA